MLKMLKNTENIFSDFFFNTKQIDLVVYFPAISAYSDVIWGGVAAWLTAGKARHRARQATHRAEIAERDARQLEEQISDLKAKAVRTGKAVAPAPRDVA